jgi:hypothetical protein
MLTKTLTATVLAASLAFGGVATPARADRGETVRTVIGIAALALIAKELARQRERDRARQQVDRNPQPDWPDRNHDWHNPRPPGRHDWKGTDPRHQQRYSDLPAACAFDIRGQHGPSTVVGKSCLREQGVRARLPDWCEFSIRTKFGARQVYGANCLRDNGYRIEARR